MSFNFKVHFFTVEFISVKLKNKQENKPKKKKKPNIAVLLEVTLFKSWKSLLLPLHT